MQQYGQHKCLLGKVPLSRVVILLFAVRVHSILESETARPIPPVKDGLLCVRRKPAKPCGLALRGRLSSPPPPYKPADDNFALDVVHGGSGALVWVERHAHRRQPPPQLLVGVEHEVVHAHEEFLDGAWRH